MPFFNVLLRLLLSLSLVLYGSGVAAAATGMQMAHATATAHSIDPATGRVSEGGPAPCHDAAETTVSAAEDPAETADVGTDISTSTHGSPDCCEASGCDCSCIQQVQVASIALGVENLAPDRSTAVRAMTAGHASPALPHLIRPPIG